MGINGLIFRNLKKNIKNYYLYVFALVATVALYFAFVTLQFNPSMDEAEGSIKGAAAIRTASVLLIAIVSIFLLYANTIFIKRRGKEIGLFQLIGMTKNKIFLILTAENFLLYFGSMVIGIVLGFYFSRLVLMILFKIIGVEAIAGLHFSIEALIQTLIVFFAIYLLIMVMNYLFIKRQSILSLFRTVSTTEGKVKKISIFTILIGIAGLAMIISGYYISSRLFSGDFVTVNEMSMAMVAILGLVIIGTYLFYKGSVSTIFYSIRKSKNGYLSINEVLSLSSIMFRMKSNALLLTIITTVSALAIGFLSLSYISYYSAEKQAEDLVAADFAFTVTENADKFKEGLVKAGIPYQESTVDVLQVEADLTDIAHTNFDDNFTDSKATPIPVVSEKAVKGLEIDSDEFIFTELDDIFANFISLKDSGEIHLSGVNDAVSLKFLGTEKKMIVSYYFTGGGLPVAIVDDSIFQRLKADLKQEIQYDSSIFIGITLKDEKMLEKANEIYNNMSETFTGDTPSLSRLEMSNSQKMTMGFMMFIVGFLGLTFLIASGCILYFKQMNESEEERPHYTILRKLGFTNGDMLKGILGKQVFNFGIPLFVGLLHSFYAVKSGWFFFGTELWTPMIIVMVLYTALYSIFGFLSVLYYRKVIGEAL